jgi:hypothetical protein
MRFWTCQWLDTLVWRPNCAMLYLRSAGDAARARGPGSAPALNFRH